jgi:hypothetical protein
MSAPAGLEIVRRRCTGIIPFAAIGLLWLRRRRMQA